MRNIKVRSQSFDRLSVKNCRHLMMGLPDLRRVVFSWYDGPAADLFNQPQMLRRLVIRSLKEMSYQNVEMRDVKTEDEKTWEVIPELLRRSYGGTSS